MCREKIILNEQLKKHLLIIITLLISGCFLKLTAQQNSYFAGATLIGNYNKNFKTGISQPGVQL